MLVREIIDRATREYGEYTAIRWLEKKEIKEIDYSSLESDIKKIRRGLRAEGFDGAHIALIGSNALEWMESYMGVVTGNTTAIPLDAAMPVEDLIDMLDRSDSTGLFLGEKCLPMLEPILSACGKLKKVWVMTKGETDITDERVSTLAKLMSLDSDDDPIPDPEALAMIIFTSGTTGKSKGVMLTQSNLATNVEAVQYDVKPGDVAALSVLPIHHAFCLVMDWLKAFQLGSCVCINDSLLHMVKNMNVFHPATMLMVPLMIETIYKRIKAMGDVPPEEVREKVFGGRLKVIFTGGAHLDPYYINEFLKYGVKVLEGYGMSECSPVISSNSPHDFKPGSIGKPLPNVEVKFVDGEILVRGTSVMRGYYKMENETNETLADGWLHTGDLGYMDEDGFLWISGRAKNLIILSNGENISPEELEGKLALDPLVGEVIVTGEDDGLTARIYPDQDVIAAKGIQPEEIEPLLRGVIDEFNKTQPTYRQIVGLVVRKNPFIKSATRKIKRQEVLIDEPQE
ncbi:MAG: AMP-binding protein [Eubacterium sp.]|nr:AMP-binding protein [Eubacterium sp.]MBR0119958.1 AMP-binding protein [Eubacterium sp.]